MVFNVDLNYKTKVTTKKDNRLENRLLEWQRATLKRLSQAPGKVKRPIRWTSERQRRAFFATKGFGRGIPTRRTGRVTQWAVFVDYNEIEKLQGFTRRLIAFVANLNPLKKKKLSGNVPDGALIGSITNTASYQRYVTGADQQGFHADTGWIKADPIIAWETVVFENILKDTGIL